MNRSMIDIKIPQMNTVQSVFAFESDFYQIQNWAFDFGVSEKNDTLYNDCFCIVFMNRGNYSFDISKNKYQTHTGHIVVEKPDFEYRIGAAAGAFSVYNFKDDFYKQLDENLNRKKNYFFSNTDTFTQIICSTPEMEYLHYYISTRIPFACKLEMDNLVVELLLMIAAVFKDYSAADELKKFSKANYLTVIEKAKAYIHKNFCEDISLQEIAAYSCVSPFHFSRIFKKMTAYSPHQYLLQLRLKHGELLLKNGLLPVSDISHVCAFNSPEHFATAFKYKYKMTPSLYRKQWQGRAD